MKFPNTKSETFFRNLVKHNLNRYEWKVLVAFIVDHPDPKEFSITLTEFVKRTGIKKPNISRSLRGLVFQGILIKNDSDWLLNKDILESDYVPKEISSTNMRNTEESKHKKGSGNFKKQSDTKKEKIKTAEENIKSMLKKTASKKKASEWQEYFSKIRQSNIFAKVDKRGDKNVILFSEDPKTSRQPIAPMDIAEEFCREILRIKDPEEMLNYMYSAYIDEFARKYKIRLP